MVLGTDRPGHESDGGRHDYARRARCGPHILLCDGKPVAVDGSAGCSVLRAAGAHTASVVGILGR